MCPPGSAFRVPPRSSGLARSRPEAPEQSKVHNRRHVPGKVTTLCRHLFAPAREPRTARSTQRERLRTSRLAPANLPAEPGLPHTPTADLLLAIVRDRPKSKLPDARTIPGLPFLPDVGSPPFPLQPGRF